MKRLPSIVEENNGLIFTNFAFGDSFAKDCIFYEIKGRPDCYLTNYDVITMRSMRDKKLWLYFTKKGNRYEGMKFSEEFLTESPMSYLEYVDQKLNK